MSPAPTPIPIPFGAARHTVVFVIADDELVGSPSWRDYVEQLPASASSDDLVVPIALTAASNLPPQLAKLQAMRFHGVTGDELEVRMLNDVMHDLSRRLDPTAAKVSVFLSHAKQDGLEITTSISRYLHEVARLDEFFDARDIPDGSTFADVLTRHAGLEPVLLAVQTDTYASREWCRLEVLEAKRRRVPIVVLSAVSRGEARAFPYMGNVPVVRWHGEASRPVIVGALLREVLRTRYFPQRAQAICRLHGLSDEHEVFSYPPELLTALVRRAEAAESGTVRNTYLYPDPPLGSEELDLLQQFDPQLNAVTPTILRSR